MIEKINLYKTRRILYAESNNEERENSSREVRSNEVQLSNESQKTRVDNSDNESEINRTFNTNTEEASQRVEKIIEQMKQQEGITEEMKAKDQMKWIGLMNNIRMTAEEIVANELIYI